MISEAYRLDKDIKNLSVENDFVVNTGKACYELGRTLRPFCIFANEKQKEYNVIDFASFTGFTNPDKNLIDEISEIRREQYREIGVYLSQDVDKKVLFFDYLISVSACYIEVPKYITKEGIAQESYDKYLMTKNPAIIASWLGISVAEATAKYSGKLKANGYDFDNGLLRGVKLMHSGKGNTVTVPRIPMNCAKASCNPLYMLWNFVEGFKTIIDTKIVEFGYLKDNGTIRVLPTTLNPSIIREYYDDNLFVNMMLGGIDINSVQQGELSLSSKINRGYIKVPELGISKYDGTGCRSLNIARLLYAKEVAEVDRSFINVDLSSVQLGFENAVEGLLNRDSSQIIPMFKALTNKDPESDKPVIVADEAKQFVNTMMMIFSTTYQKELHLFMVKNPMWFPKYLGTPIKDVALTTPVSIGVETFKF